MTTMPPKITSRNKRTILLVEDNPDDVAIFKYAFEKNNIRDTVDVVPNGEEAVEYLSRRATSDKPTDTPQLVITDLLMPVFDGLQLAQWMRRHQKFRTLPLVLLSSANHEEAKAKAYRLGACSYYVKPTRINDFVPMIRHIYQYWMKNPGELK